MFHKRFLLRGSSHRTNCSWRRIQARRLLLEPLEGRLLLANWSGDVFDTTPGVPLWTSGEVQQITGDVHIPAGKTLTVQAGTVVQFNSGTNLTVDGTLIAAGTANQTIFFTSYRDNSPTGGSDSAGAGDWGAVVFNADSSNNLMDHVEVRYGGYSGGNVPGEVIDSGPLTLTNSVLRDSYNAGLRIVGSSPIVTGVTFQNNYQAVSMDLASSPVIAAPAVQGNTFNAVVLDSGSIAGSVRWNGPGMFFRLSGDVTVPAGATLEVVAGQAVQLNGGKNLTVNGTLTAAGTAAAPVTITSYQDTSPLGGATNASDGDWGAITFNPGSDASSMDHVVVRYGGYSAGTVDAAVVVAANVTLSNSTFRNCYNGGVRVINSSPILSNDTWLDNVDRFGALAFAVSMDLASHPVITNPTATGNDVNGVLLDSGDLPASNAWDNPGIVYRLSGDLTVPSAMTLTIGAGQVIKSYRASLLVNGTLRATGTAERPIIFTSYGDDSAGGDTNNDGESTGTAFDWDAIQFGASSTGSVMDHTEVRYGGFFTDGLGYGEIIVDGSLTLRNSIVRDSSHVGVLVHPGATATLTSNLIVRNLIAGVQAQAGSTLTAVSNTIDGNGGFGGVNYGYGFILDSPTATLTNNLITNNISVNDGVGILQTGPTNLTMRFNNVFNPGRTNYIGLADQTGTNGNTSVDPKYFSRANLSYQLRPGSPVEDAGTSNGAPATDLFGNPRFDDPNITGRGDDSGTDMGAIESQEVATSTVDLSTFNVSGPTTGSQGLTATVAWTVKDIGTGAATGPWSDALYLSDTPVWTPDAKFLKRIQHTGDLAPGESYDASTDVTLNNVLPGNHYFLVRSNDLNDVFEGLSTANNSGASPSPINFAMPTLTLNTPFNDQFTGAGQSHYYQITVAAGQTLSFALQSAAGSGSTELYVSRGKIPSRSEFDFSGGSSLAPNQQVVVPLTQQGTYYVLAYAAFGASTSSAFTLTAGQPMFGVQGVSPATVGNSGQVTLTIQGALFTSDAQASLIAPDNSIIAATSMQLADASRLYATFDLTGKPAGSYGVRLTKGAQTINAAGAVTVKQGATGHLYTRIDAPGAIRKGNAGVVTITYGNDGEADLTAPLLVVQSTNALLGHPGQPALADSYLDFLGINSSGPAGVLPPGAQGRIQLPFVAQSDGNINISVTQTNRATTFDWASVKALQRPSDVTTEAWNAIYANFLASVGTTSGDYEAALAQDATYLSQLGDYTADVSRLLNFEFLRAGNFGAIAERYRLGALGRGWPDPTDVAAKVDAQGNVAVHAAGSIRPFIRQANGAYVGLAGETAKLNLAGGIYQLRETDGSLSVFNANGTINYTADSNGLRVTAGYTGTQLTSLTDSFGDVVAISYDGHGRISKITDPVGRTTNFAFDAAGEHLLSITDAQGTTQFTYVTGQSPQTEHAVQSVVYPDWNHAFFAYDNRGHLIKTTAEGGANEIDYSYDGVGKSTVTDVQGHTTMTLVNDFGQPAIVQDQLGNITRYFYDRNHALTQVVGPDGGVVSVTSDTQGNPATVTDPLGQTVRSTFDSALNQLQTIRDQRGNTLSYRMDSHGNTLAITYADGSSEQFSHDAAGNVTSMKNRRGNFVHFSYDALNLLMREDFADGTHTEFTYDSHRNLVSATSAVGSTTYVYDLATDRVTQKTYPDGYYLKFTYDAAGRRTMSVDQNGFTINYSYDTLGRLHGLTDGNNSTIITYTYDSVGVSGKVLGNATFTTYDYYADGAVANLVNHAADGSVLSHFDYTYDLLGRIASMTTGEGTTQYGYDATGQLTSVALPGGRTVLYQYDAAGNRVTVTDDGTATNYTTNNLNQYTSIGTTQLAYDTDGNLLSRTDSTGTTSYDYNAAGQLVSMTTPTDNFTYHYDALGTRIATTHNGQRTSYLVDPAGLGNVVAEYDGSGALLANFTYAGGLVSQVGPAGVASYYHFDAVGNTSQLTDSTGAAINSYAYLPFGEIRNSSVAQANPFTFNGQLGVMSDGNGTYFMRTREYDANTGRFTTQDPLGVDGGLNLYGFVQNNPTSETDPTGLNSRIDFLISVIERGYGNLPAVPGFKSPLPDVFDPVLLAAFQRAHKGNLVFDEPQLIKSLEEIAEKRKLIFNGSPARVALPTNGATVETLLTTAETPIVAAETVGAEITAATETVARPLARTNSGGSIIRGTSSFAVSKARRVLSTAVKVFGVVGDAYFAFEEGYATGTYINDHVLPDRVKDAIGNGILYFLDHEAWKYRTYTSIVGQNSPVDPNDLFGPLGFGSQHFAAPDQSFPYTILFENQPSATAPALVVKVTQQLDAKLDWTTFELGDFGFGKYTVHVPASRRFYSTRVDASDTVGEFVDVTADFDPSTGQATWTFTSVDPATGELPEGATDGFLPPDDAAQSGEGFVTYRVRPIAGGTTGTTIPSQARVFFDAGLPDESFLDTPTFTNTFDTGSPTSSVTALPANSPATFTVSWSGSDDVGGSGIASFDIFMSEDGGPFQLWQNATTALMATFDGEVDHVYAFYSVATDNVGHVEQKNSGSEATTKVVAGPPWQNPVEPKDVNRDGTIAPQDVLIVINELNDPKFSDPVTRVLNARTGTESFFFDVNGDDSVSPLDALIVINFLNSRIVQGESETGRLPGLSRSPTPGLDSRGDALPATRSLAQPRAASLAADRTNAHQFADWQLPLDSPKASLPASRSRATREELFDSVLDEDWNRLLNDLATDVAAAGSTTAVELLPETAGRSTDRTRTAFG